MEPASESPPGAGGPLWTARPSGLADRMGLEYNADWPATEHAGRLAGVQRGPASPPSYTGVRWPVPRAPPLYPQERTAGSMGSHLDPKLIAGPLRLSPPHARMRPPGKMHKLSSRVHNNRRHLDCATWPHHTGRTPHLLNSPGEVRPIRCGVENRVKAVGPAGHASTHYSPGQPIDLGVVASLPRRPENLWGRGCQDEEQADVLMAPREKEGEGLVLVRHCCQDCPIETRLGLGSGRVSMGMRACLAKS